MKKGVLFASADIRDYRFCTEYTQSADVIICCDGGLRHCAALGIVPDYLLGDFDSVEPSLLEEYKEKKIPVKQYPSHKDETDMELGMRLAEELGITDLAVLGGIGSRLDHTLANVHLLYRLMKKGIHAVLADDKNKARLLYNGCMKVRGNPGDIISLIPLSEEVSGINLKGMEYPLVDAVLPFDTPRGVSNVLLGAEGEITAQKGLLLVVSSRD